MLFERHCRTLFNLSLVRSTWHTKPWYHDYISDRVSMWPTIWCGDTLADMTYLDVNIRSSHQHHMKCWASFLKLSWIFAKALKKSWTISWKDQVFQRKRRSWNAQRNLRGLKQYSDFFSSYTYLYIYILKIRALDKIS